MPKQLILISHRIADVLAELIVPIEIGPQTGCFILDIEETSFCEKAKGWNCQLCPGISLTG